VEAAKADGRFVEPDQIDATLAGELRELQAAGWTVGAYSGVNMRNLSDTQGAGAALDKLKALSAGMAQKGFATSVLAPNQRAWGVDLAEQARGIFALVRVCGDFRAFEDWPIPAPLYMDRGGTPSLSASDTVKSLQDTLSLLIADGGLWVVVIHKVGDDDPAYSVKTDVLRGFLDAVVRERDAGRIMVITLGKDAP
jgi:hypothetical protein